MECASLLDILRSAGFLVRFDLSTKKLTVDPGEKLSAEQRDAVQANAAQLARELIREEKAAAEFSSWLLSLPDPFAAGIGVSPSSLDALARAAREYEQTRREIREKEAAAESERQAKVQAERKRDRRRREKKAGVGGMF